MNDQTETAPAPEEPTEENTRPDPKPEAAAYPKKEDDNLPQETGFGIGPVDGPPDAGETIISTTGVTTTGRDDPDTLMEYSGGDAEEAKLQARVKAAFGGGLFGATAAGPVFSGPALSITEDPRVAALEAKVAALTDAGNKLCELVQASYFHTEKGGPEMAAWRAVA